MAATSAANLQVLAQIAQGYAPVYIDEVLTLLQSGIVRYDTAPPFPREGANTYTIRGLYYTTGTAQTPTANTNLNVNALSSNTQIGVIRRRADAFGFETAAALAGGISEDALASEIARVMTNGAAVDIETGLLTSAVSGVFSVDGTLSSTNVLNKTSEVYSHTFIAEAQALMGMKGAVLDTIMMHSTIFHKRKIADLLTSVASVQTITNIQDANAYATTLVGAIGNMRVVLNDRVPTSNGTYCTLVCGSGANAPLYLGVERNFNIEYDRNILLAGGTDIWKYTHSHSPAVAGVSWTGTAPSVIGGVTDAALATYTNWTKVTGHVASQTPAVAIWSLAE